jgi:hypothetical protein
MSSVGERRLQTATTIAAVEAVAQIVLVLARNGGRTPLLAASIAVKLPFCLLARRHSPGAFMGLVLWELAAVLAVVAGSGIPPALRLAQLAVAVAVLLLLGGAAHVFPGPRLPER